MSLIYAMDTNIIIKYLRGDLNVSQNFEDAVMRGYELVIPRVVDYEIRRGFNILYAPKKEAAYNLLTKQCLVIEIDTSLWERAIQVYGNLYRKGFTVGEIDIFISALCLENDYILVTNNIADFENIDELRIVDWTQIQ